MPICVAKSGVPARLQVHRYSSFTFVNACGKRGKIARNVVDKKSRLWHTRWALVVPFCWTGGYRSLTTDTMCQNLFETIRVFERGWIE